jgi:hypothetical protein
VRVEADTDAVRAYLDGRLVADHARCWARHQTLADPEHADAAAVMREGHRFALIHGSTAAAVEVEERELPSYDRVLRLIEGGAGTEG